MATKTDTEIESIYKGAHSHSHTAALRAVYQAGAADAGTAQKERESTGKVAGSEPKRPIKNPGAPTTTADSPTVQGETANSPATADGGTPAPPGAKANIPNTPAPGTDPPGGEQLPANAG